MSDVDFEYAIRTDVRNNPIVREVDRDRLREQWRWALVCAMLAIVVLFTAWQQFQLIRYGYKLEDLREQRATEEQIQRRLRLELEVLGSPRRIGAIATDRLNLVPATPATSVIVERVTTSTPSRALVASR
jgi:cell division protein FtsL